MEFLTAIVCTVAALALSYRLASRWDETGILVHTLGGLLVASVVLVSVWVALAPPAETVGQLMVLGGMSLHGIGCILSAIWWPTLQFKFVVPIPRRETPVEVRSRTAA